MRLAITEPINGLAGQLVKIGTVARRFGISPDLLRLYEREGLLVPLKSVRGTRYFTPQDYDWIATLLRLVRDARMNFAALRHLLGMTPCWSLRQCGHDNRENCPVQHDRTRPCWMSRACCKAFASDCYTCPVYRAAPQSEALQALLIREPQPAKKNQVHV